MDDPTIVAIIALLVSLVALLVTFTQLLQSSALSAEGWRRCNSTVMGRWSVFSRRRWLWSDLRCEVKFTVPEIRLVDSTSLYTGQLGFVQPDFVSKNRDGKFKEWVFEPDTKFKRPEEKSVRDALHILGFNSLPNDIEADFGGWKRTGARFLAARYTTKSDMLYKAYPTLVSLLVSCRRWLRGYHFHLEPQFESYHAAIKWTKTSGVTWNLLLEALFACQKNSWENRPSDPDHLDLVDNAKPSYFGMETLLVEKSERFIEHKSKEWLRKGETIVCLDLHQQSWDSLPPDVVRPLARSTLSTVVILARRLGMQWTSFDTSKEQCRAEGNGCSLSAVGARGLGLVFRFDTMRRLYNTGRGKFVLEEMLASKPADKAYFGIIAGDTDLNISDYPLIDRDRHLDVDRFLKEELGEGPLRFRSSYTPWCRIIANDVPALMSPFMPLTRSRQWTIFSPMPTRSRFELSTQLSFFKAFGTHEDLRSKLNDHLSILLTPGQTVNSKSDSVIPEPTACIATNSLEIMFKNHLKDRRSNDRFTTQEWKSINKGSKLATSDAEIDTQRIEEVEVLRRVHAMATGFFQARLPKDISDENPPIRSFKDLIVAHMDLVAHCYFDWRDAEFGAQKSKKHGGKHQAGRAADVAKTGLDNGWNNLLKICKAAEKNLHVFRNSLREMWDGYRQTEDTILDDFWWVLMARGVTWQMTVRTLHGGHDSMVPSSIYGSEMPVWIE